MTSYAKRLFSVLLCLLLPLSACVMQADDSTASPDGTESKNASVGTDASVGADISADESTQTNLPVLGDSVTYVALGDSICRGYGLDDPEAQRYSTLLAEQTGCKVFNYGVDGLTGSGLLTLLQSGKVTALADANIVTVSIGANNIMQAAYTFLPTLLSAALQHVPVDAESLLAPVDASIAQFRAELPEIASTIHELAPNAVVIWQTVYNPFAAFKHITLTLNGQTYSIASFVDGYIQQLNDIIRNGAQAGGYTVCDVHTAFAQSSRNNVNASPFPLVMDPHPNADGHKLIAQTYLPFFKQLA